MDYNRMTITKETHQLICMKYNKIVVFRTKEVVKIFSFKYSNVFANYKTVEENVFRALFCRTCTNAIAYPNKFTDKASKYYGHCSKDITANSFNLLNNRLGF